MSSSYVQFLENELEHQIIKNMNEKYKGNIYLDAMIREEIRRAYSKYSKHENEDELN